ncbi:MAG: ATP-binding protein [Acidobacteriota bacterium]
MNNLTNRAELSERYEAMLRYYGIEGEKIQAGQARTALVEQLKELHLPAMRACFEETARRAEKETLSYEQYLLELAFRECEGRRRNRVRKLLKESGLPLEKSLANFDLKRLPVKVGRQMKYTTSAMLVQDLLVAKRELRLNKEIKKLAKYDGVIIDEMGYVQQGREEMEVLFTLLAERYERGSVLLGRPAAGRYCSWPAAQGFAPGPPGTPPARG